MFASTAKRNLGDDRAVDHQLIQAELAFGKAAFQHTWQQ